jgi:hypothetical protein
MVTRACALRNINLTTTSAATIASGLSSFSESVVANDNNLVLSSSKVSRFHNEHTVSVWGEQGLFESQLEMKLRARQSAEKEVTDWRLLAREETETYQGG